MKTLTMYKRFSCSRYYTKGTFTKGYLQVCKEALDELVMLPPDAPEITLVGLKKPTPDTVKIEMPTRGYALWIVVVDGVRYPMLKDMYFFLREWIKAGYDNIRVEYHT